MNFTACQSSPGQWLMMKGLATRFEIKQGQYGPYGLGDLLDTTGRSEKMLFGASEKSPLPQESLLNRDAIYSVQWDANTQKFKAYFKSWDNGQQTTTVRTTLGGGGRQQVTQTPQSSKDDSIERQCAWKSACTVAASSGKEFALEETLRWAAAGLKFIETGEAEFQEDTPAPDDAPALTDDDIPF